MQARTYMNMFAYTVQSIVILIQIPLKGETTYVRTQIITNSTIN